MNFRIPVLFLLIFSAIFSYAQDPCTTAPGQGYAGKCDIISIRSSDGRYLYTSDKLTLKKWDLKTRKIVDEISPAPAKFSEAEVLPDAATKSLLPKNERTTYLPSPQIYLYWKKEERFLYNVSKRESLKTTLPSGIARLQATPDPKIVLMQDPYATYFVNVETGTTLKTIQDPGQITFKSDGSGFFTVGLSFRNVETSNFHFVRHYTFPDCKLISEIVPGSAGRFIEKFPYVYSVIADADRDIVYIHSITSEDPLSLPGFKFPGAIPADTFSLKRVKDASEEEADKKRKERNLEVANKMIEKLPSLVEPSPRHSSRENVLKLKIDDYTQDGKVLIREEYIGTNALMLWSFPDGKPLELIHNGDKTEGLGGSPIVVREVILNGLLSPSGKEIGVNYYAKSAIFENRSVKIEFTGKKIAALFDGKALVYPVDAKKNDWTLKNFELINTSTGEVIQKVKAAPMDGNVLINSKYAPGRLIFHWNKFEHGVYVFDINAPGSITKVQSPGSGSLLKGLMLDNLANEWYDVPNGKSQSIPGYIYPVAGNQGAKIDGRYLLTNRKEVGWQVFDAKEGKFNAPLYCGWVGFTDAVFISGLNKLLVVTKSPEYTAPNAGPEDPGASAYTIDAATNEIIPYLLTETRAAQEKYFKENAAKNTWTYSKTDCEYAADRFRPNFFLTSAIGSNPTYLMLGYDCEENVYVVAERVKSSFEGVPFNVIRFHKKTGDDLLSYSMAGGPFEICPNCGGVTAGKVSTYYTGWSNWEQKYANIYTRKYVVNQKIDYLKHCNVCNGNAWIKK